MPPVEEKEGLFRLSRPRRNMSDESARRERSRNLARLRTIAPSRTIPKMTAPFRKLTPSKRPSVTTQGTSRATVEARNDALLRAARARLVEAELYSVRDRKSMHGNDKVAEVEQRDDKGPRGISREVIRQEKEWCRKTGTRNSAGSRLSYLKDEQMKEWGVINIERSLRYRCTGGNQRQRGVDIFVGNELWDGTGAGTVLEQLRSVYGDKVSPMEDVGISNGIRWRSGLKKGAVDSGWGMVVMSGEGFVEYLERSLIRQYVQWVIARMQLIGNRLIIAGVGVDDVLKRRHREASNTRAVEISDNRAVADCCTMLMMEFGIRVTLFNSEEELAGYILHVTDGIDKERFYKGHSYFEAMVEYRREGSTRAMAAENEVRGVRVDEEGDLGSVYMRILTEMGGLRKEEALGIRERFPTLTKLFREVEQFIAREDAIRMLAEVTRGDDGIDVGTSSASTIAEAVLSEDGSRVVQF